MFSVLLLISVAGLAGADDFTIRCTNDSSRNGMSFEPVSEGIIGRYKLEVCTEVKPEYKQWEVVVSFRNQTSTCINDWKLLYQFKHHSSNFENVHFDTDCMHACLTKNFDLIFAACYSIESKFLLEAEGEYRSHPQPTTYTFNVNNSYTLAQFTANTVTVDFIPHRNGITIIWHPGVPVQGFEVEICNANVTDKEYERLPCLNASAMCSRGDAGAAGAVRCALPAPAACISVTFAHVAPWISGRLHVQGTAHIPYTYCPREADATAVDVSGSSWAGAGAAGAVALGAALALALRRLWSTRRATRARKRVLKLWLQTTSNEPSPRVSATKASRHILLLHARENDAGQRVVDALTAILRDATDGQVHSLYSPSTMSLAGAAPGAWLRAALARDDVALVLLQTPALRALHALHAAASSPREGGGDVTVCAPALGRTVVPREPAFGDTLLQYALRLLADTHLAHAYHKLYIATLTELPTEVFPRVVPYRRYSLPEAASLLAREASGHFAQLPPPKPADNTIAPAEDEKMAKNDILDVKQELLNETVAYFVEIVKENPRYLMDELVAL